MSSTLTDDEVKDAVADAISDVILLTGGVFGKALEVTARDDAYQAPTEYRTSGELSLEEGSVIAAQVGLTYHYNFFRAQKVSERIINEAQEWDYSLSANVALGHIKALQDQRDRALDAITAMTAAPMEAYASFLATRDSLVSQAIEPWVDASSGRGGVEQDWRFVH